MQKMTKMEAIGHLCTLKKRVEEQLAFARRSIEKEDREDYLAYRQEEIVELENQIRAIEMAGTSMTR
ncbi:MAG: hypothetical protein AB1568_04635 [Thermodesulfobacteriota bacterium]